MFLRMSQNVTWEQKLYFKMLQQLLCIIPAMLTPSELKTPLVTISNCCSWFPEAGTLDIELWEKAGHILKHKFLQGKLKDPHVITTWAIVRIAFFHLYTVDRGVFE